jgi:branched-chain amino acid transport system ATP-binding protein
MTDILKVENISVRFGGVKAVDNLSFSVKGGELLGFIGPNGAGKTTALKIITGILNADAGRVYLGGEDITSIASHKRIRKGIALTHQIVRPFRSLTVKENVVIAAGLKKTRRPLGSLFTYKREAEEVLAREILSRVGLIEQEKSDTSSLPLGQLKRLEVARALALRPKVLLFDEPLAGLNQQEAAAMVDTLVELNQDGLSVVLVEYNLGEVMRVSTRLQVVDNGHMIASGTPDDVMKDPRVQEAYLGGSEECYVTA